MKKTPVLHTEIKKFKYPGYINVFEMMPDAKSLYGTETLYGDWDGCILLLAKDAAPLNVIKKLIKKEGVKAWRHAQRELGDEGGWRTNERLVKLCEPIKVGKLYGSVAANMLLKQDGWSRPLPDIKKQGELRCYLKFVLTWVSTEMDKLEVIACLGADAWHVASEAIGKGEVKNDYAKYRDEGRALEGIIGGKKIILTAHYHPAARVSNEKHLKSWGQLYKRFG